MNCCSKKCINLITLIIVIVIFVQTNILTIMIFNLSNNNIVKSVKMEETKEKLHEQTEEKYIIDEKWELQIPKINVSAKIKEGTGEEIINNNIGHFKETPYINGNIGLIAASEGYKENYFENLHKLVEGDIIIYIKGETKKEYKVTTNVEISETDWSYLSSTNDDRLTLITGISEKPEYRRCVQAQKIN